MTVALAIAVAAEARDFRDFTNQSGATIHAELLAMQDGSVKNRSKDNVFEVAVDTPSYEDQTWLHHNDGVPTGQTIDINEVHYADFVVKAAPKPAQSD